MQISTYTYPRKSEQTEITERGAANVSTIANSVAQTGNGVSTISHASTANVVLAGLIGEMMLRRSERFSRSP